MTPTDDPLRVGPCKAWCEGSTIAGSAAVSKAVANLNKGQNTSAPNAQELEELAETAAEAASDVLYELSGRQFSGADCGPVTIRPVARPTDADSRMTAGRLAGAANFGAWSGGAGFSGMGATGILSRYGIQEAPAIDLGVYPVTEITLVKIDGVDIPEAEYELRDRRVLIRLRPTASSVPTERWGWPTTQVPDLPDTQPGTFSITYKYGVAPPAAGVRAAERLAEILLLPALGDNSRFPGRVTSMSRQGVTANVTDVMDILKTGATGIYEVDLFLLAHNPGKNQRQSLAWSPDIQRPRRTQHPSTS